MSPGFTPRPSLSGGRERAAHHGARRVAGVHAPAFVERTQWLASRRRAASVAGVHAPAFVERRPTRRAPPTTGRSGVAGVHAPAFVERAPSSTTPPTGACVSPGFTPRPSLSDAGLGDSAGEVVSVSPGFTPRPSLSVHRVRPAQHGDQRRVAGVHAPAFVERSVCAVCDRKGRAAVSPGFTPRPSLSGLLLFRRGRRARPRVAGVHAPAFVERGWRSRRFGVPLQVSPGFTPRPSLSAIRRC